MQKVCFDCEFCKEQQGFFWCEHAKLLKLDEVTGRPVRELTCVGCRNDLHKCSHTGRWFVPRPPSVAAAWSVRVGVWSRSVRMFFVKLLGR
jgi:hypothetical protein